VALARNSDLQGIRKSMKQLEERFNRKFDVRFLAALKREVLLTVSGSTPGELEQHIYLLVSKLKRAFWPLKDLPQ
jgi:hypothetical protein